MANTPERFDENIEQPRSRRGFLTWVGQVAAGVSIAGIGLGLVKPLEAFAAPECNPCTGCRILCQEDRIACCPEGYPIFMKIQSISGCVPPGCVYSNPFYACSTTLNICPSQDARCSTCP